MSNYRMMECEGSCTFNKIIHNRKWVGRVYPKGDGSFGAKIGDTEATGASRREAFGAVVAKRLGHSSEQALAAHNSKVREQNKVCRDEARSLGHDYRSAKTVEERFEVFDKLFGLGRK